MFTLRAATPKDVDILASIEAQSFPEAEMATRESFEKRLAVFPDNRTISDDMFENASLHVPNGRWQSVFGLAVIPSKRHQGCASTLMRAFIEKARQEGRDGLILTCKEKLIPFYEGFGYVNCGVSKSVHGGAVWYDMELDFREKPRDY